MSLTRYWLVPLLMVVAAGLGFTVLSLPEGGNGLQLLVTQHMHESGVDHPVTAVLLNFRAYDTLLELAVLLLAVMGVWSFGVPYRPAGPPPGRVLETLTRLLVPLFILVSAYVVWIGAHEPGGAFQAGAMLSAAGILLVLAGWQPPALLGRAPLRVALILGLAVFAIVALSTLVTGRALLQYPPSYAGGLILLIECAATIAIGVTLTLLFIGTAPTDKHQ